MDRLDLIKVNNELYMASKRLDAGSKKLFKLAEEFAKAEERYRYALAIEIDRLKQDGQSVTLIPDLARGNTSKLKLDRDLAEFTYTSARDSLKAIAVQISALQSILRTQESI